MKKKKFAVLTVLLALLAVFLMAGSVSAAPAYRNKWVKENGKVYYYNEKGKRNHRGLVTIKKKTYYFDSKYVQRTGWQKIDGKYYFFEIRNGSNGYMQTSTTVNGITLTKKGWARYDSAGQRKLETMIKANKIMESVTDYTMTKPQKLRKCYDELISWRKKYVGSFQKYRSDWDVYYADLMFTNKAGDCYPFGCAMAYLANAVGYHHVYAVSSGSHGWAEVSNKVYDPSWDYSTGKTHKFYALDPKTYNGWPTYRLSRKYVKKI